MAYVRERGNQLCIVHGVRDPKTGNVQQEILFTIYSKEEALAAIGKSDQGQPFDFKQLLEDQYPEIKFEWKTIQKDIEASMRVLPATYTYGPSRSAEQFYPSLKSFAKNLILNDPQNFLPTAALIQQHRLQLEYLAELIQFRVEHCTPTPNRFNKDNKFCWRSACSGSEIPPETAEHVEGMFERGEYDRAEAVLRLVVDCFDGYADGYNLLGLISEEKSRMKEAIEHFRKAIEVGKKQIRRRIGRKNWWNDISTRPYMRGLMNLASALNRSQRCDEALIVCAQLEDGCASKEFADHIRARIFLNMGRWQDAASAALAEHRIVPTESFLVAFATFEIGQHLDALTHFLYAALNAPRAAYLLADLKAAKPKSYEAARDRNEGVEIWNSTMHFRSEMQSPASRKFFQKMMRDARVAAMLAEVEDLSRRRSEDRSAQSEAFTKLATMREWSFAQHKATELMDLLGRGSSARLVTAQGGPMRLVH